MVVVPADPKAIEGKLKVDVMMGEGGGSQCLPPVPTLTAISGLRWRIPPGTGFRCHLGDETNLVAGVDACGVLAYISRNSVPPNR